MELGLVVLQLGPPVGSPKSEQRRRFREKAPSPVWEPKASITACRVPSRREEMAAIGDYKPA